MTKIPPIQSFTGANDNSPAWAIDVAAGRIEQRPRVAKQRSSNSLVSGLTGLLWLVPILALMAGLSAWWMQLSPASLIRPSTGLGVLLILTAALTEKTSRLRNLSVLTAIGAFATLSISLVAKANISLSATDISVLVSGLSIVVAWVFKSRPALMLSGFSSLIWLASLSPTISATLGTGTPVSQGWLPLFPLLIVAQGFLATHLRSHSTLFVIILSSYGFLITAGINLPVLALTGLVFAIAAAHYRLGKAWVDTKLFGARLHLTSGWLAALGAAVSVQLAWLNLETGRAEPLWTPHQGWWLALGVSAILLFTASILRYKHAQITLSGIFLVSLAALILPIATVRPDIVYLAFDSFPGLPARPGFGFVIGAAIMASGLAWVVNGLRKGDVIDMILGAVAVGFQGLILFNPNWFNLDFAIIFCLSLICALCVSGLIAGASLNHAKPARRYA